ncbi:MAG: hypothetical protein NE330_22095 [Lentisphaeraceae bacterium]|nr:hypothetical protein [Lentisphaeraceae bacterium]
MVFSGNWYCLYTKSQQESLVQENLKHEGFNCYLPQILKKTKSARRFLEKRYPLFPCYIFVEANTPDEIFQLKTIRGAHYLLQSKDGSPLPVANEVLENLDSHCTDGIFIAENQEFQKGDSVSLAAPCFNGVKAIFQNYENSNNRVSILLDLLEGQTVVVDSSQVKKIVE